MARPTRISVVSGQQAWDSTVNDDFKLVLNRPFPLCQHASNESTALTEANLASSYAAASYADCLVWVAHSVRGTTLYRSDGSSWIITRAMGLFERSVSTTTTIQDYDDVVVCTGSTYTVTLPPAAGNLGRVIYIKRTSSGTIVIDGNASEQIDGSATLSLTTALQSAVLVCDGSNWFSLGGSGGGGGGGTTGLLVLESFAAVGTISATTNLAICSGTTYTITLPSAATVTAGWQLYVKRTASGTITIDGSGSETIDGALTYLLERSNESVLLVSDGTNWSVDASFRGRLAPLNAEAISTTATIGNTTEVAICSGSTYTVTLPAAATYGAGRILIVKRTSSGTITLDGNSSETIDGATTFAMSLALSAISLYCDGSNWHIV